MCGVVGILKNTSIAMSPETVIRMTEGISHRGPDDEGCMFLSTSSTEGWRPCPEWNPNWRIALGSRRLSILDLSDAGHMPMTYRDQLWAVYNGEVYNFIELRAELHIHGYTFRSSSDTEVILAAYAAWGPTCFARLRGMWGLIIVDGRRNEVILCRDRLGIKPLYLWQQPGLIAIVSEIKQLQHIPDFTPRMNPTTVVEYLQTGYEDPERSFFQSVHAVPAGTSLSIPLDTLVPSSPESYWQPESIHATVYDAEEAGNLFAEKLRESIRIHLRSDVPVGCALSGGLDSSSIAALVNEGKGNSDPPLYTFSSTFPGNPSDEREYVDSVVANVRAVPHYVTPNPTTFLSELHDFLHTHDEPVGSISIYASYCVARLTRQAGISVTLNGQGGDEILSGYWQSYFLYLRQLAKHGHLFPLLQHFGGALIGNGNPALLKQVPVMLRRYYARTRSKTRPLIGLRSSLITEETPMIKKILTLDEHAWRVAEIRSMFLPRLLKWDDRNSMAFSVEGRYPFLDHELIELCLSFAPQTLYHHGWTKQPLRRGLGNILPHKVRYRRTKFGFEVPQDEWLRGPLRLELEMWLKQERPIWEYVERADVQRLAEQVWRQRGRHDEYGQALFRLFVFDRWTEVFGIVG